MNIDDVDNPELPQEVGHARACFEHVAPGQRASDDAVQALIESTVVDRAALMRRCLTALRAAGIPLDLETADCLSELGERMAVLIQEALAETGASE